MSGISESGGGSPDITDVRRLDTGTAHIARVYDYWLGGKDNFAAEVTSFFDGLELVDPGVTPIQQWRPDTPQEANAVAAMWGGVAIKP